jgi:hypothetical protein
VNRDGIVDDADVTAVLFAFGTHCTGCPEDLNSDGSVDDSDLMIVMFNFGNSAGTVSWEYSYDIWGNLTKAEADQRVRIYRAGYDALGRRVWEEIETPQGTRLTYYVYEGDTIVAEVDGSGRIVAEYVWGLLGPIARIDLQNPANTRYYVIDGLGHVRALVAPNGAITEVWHYDSRCCRYCYSRALSSWTGDWRCSRRGNRVSCGSRHTVNVGSRPWYLDWRYNWRACGQCMGAIHRQPV